MDIRDIQNCFQVQLSHFHILEAAGIARIVEIIEPTLQQRCRGIVDFLLSYHGRLLRLSPCTELISADKIREELALSASSTDIQTNDDITGENARVSALLGNSRCSPQRNVVCSFFVAYYFTVNQDGLRAAVWLRHSLEASSVIQDLVYEKRLAATRLYEAAVHRLDSTLIDEQLPAEVSPSDSFYVFLQESADYLSGLIQQSIFRAIDVFVPRISLLDQRSS